jgi:hypothetical protein
MEVPSALEEVAAVVRGFLAPHPVAKLVKELAFETKYDFFSDDEGDSTSGTYARGVRNSCWDCRRMMPQGVIGCIWDEQGEVAVEEAARGWTCARCQQTQLLNEGFMPWHFEWLRAEDGAMVTWRHFDGARVSQFVRTGEVPVVLRFFIEEAVGSGEDVPWEAPR